MEKYTYIEILIEDKSGGILVEQIMNKYVIDKQNITYKIHSFKGIGKIPLKAKKMSQIKSKRLLTDLPMYLRGMDLSLNNMLGKKAIFVILDSDDEDCVKLKQRLNCMCQELEITIQVFFCIAIEEMEAWLLGDSEALLVFYLFNNWTKYFRHGIMNPNNFGGQYHGKKCIIYQPYKSGTRLP